MKVDPILLNVISDLFINLAAGWFGAALIIPIRVSKSPKTKIGLLTLNLVLGTVFLLFAYGIKKYG